MLAIKAPPFFSNLTGQIVTTIFPDDMDRELKIIRSVLLRHTYSNK